MSNDNHVFSQVCQTMLYGERLAKMPCMKNGWGGGQGLVLGLIRQYKKASRTNLPCPSKDI